MVKVVRDKPVTLIFILLIFSLIISCIEKERAVGVKEEKRAPEQIESVPIADILKDRESFRDKRVTVSGEVTTGLAFEFVTEQPYLLNDGTGEIWVITTGVMPKESEKIIVSGKVIMPYQIKGRRYDIAIIEVERQG